MPTNTSPSMPHEFATVVAQAFRPEAFRSPGLCRPCSCRGVAFSAPERREPPRPAGFRSNFTHSLATVACTQSKGTTTHMITRRTALRLMGSASSASLLAVTRLNSFVRIASASSAADDLAPPLAPGTPNSPERLALIDAFRKQSGALEKKFEPRTHKSDTVMPYRFFRPESSASANGKLPLVVYLHGSGGLGDDNLKQLGLGKIFGTRVWLLPENQKRFPCYVAVPQTDQG